MYKAGPFGRIARYTSPAKKALVIFNYRGTPIAHSPPNSSMKLRERKDEPMPWRSNRILRNEMLDANATAIVLAACLCVAVGNLVVHNESILNYLTNGTSAAPLVPLLH